MESKLLLQLINYNKNYDELNIAWSQIKSCDKDEIYSFRKKKIINRNINKPFLDIILPYFVRKLFEQTNYEYNKEFMNLIVAILMPLIEPVEHQRIRTRVNFAKDICNFKITGLFNFVQPFLCARCDECNIMMEETNLFPNTEDSLTCSNCIYKSMFSNSVHSVKCKFCRNIFYLHNVLYTKQNMIVCVKCFSMYN